jgi:hypothetical protein
VWRGYYDSMATFVSIQLPSACGFHRLDEETGADPRDVRFCSFYLLQNYSSTGINFGL